MKWNQALFGTLVFVLAMVASCASAEQVKFDDIRIGLDGVVVLEVGGQTVAIDVSTGLVIGERRSDVLVRKWAVSTTVDFHAAGGSHGLTIKTEHDLSDAGWRRCYGVVGTFFGAVVFDKCFVDEPKTSDKQDAELAAPVEPTARLSDAEVLTGDESGAGDLATLE